MPCRPAPLFAGCPMQSGMRACARGPGHRAAGRRLSGAPDLGANQAAAPASCSSAGGARRGSGLISGAPIFRWPQWRGGAPGPRSCVAVGRQASGATLAPGDNGQVGVCAPDAGRPAEVGSQCPQRQRGPLEFIGAPPPPQHHHGPQQAWRRQCGQARGARTPGARPVARLENKSIRIITSARMRANGAPERSGQVEKCGARTTNTHWPTAGALVSRSGRPNLLGPKFESECLCVLLASLFWGPPLGYVTVTRLARAAQ